MKEEQQNTMPEKSHYKMIRLSAPNIFNQEYMCLEDEVNIFTRYINFKTLDELDHCVVFGGCFIMVSEMTTMEEKKYVDSMRDEEKEIYEKAEERYALRKKKMYE